jgi:predicted PurR-regulated permease PerM
MLDTIEAARARPRAAEASNERLETPAAAPTPISISARAAALLALAVVVALVLLLWAAPSVAPVMVGGAVLALVLSWPVGALTRVMPRGLAIAVAVGVVLLLVLLVLLAAVPLLIRQLTDVIVSAPGLTAEAEVAALQLLQPLRDRGLLAMEPAEVAGGVRQQLLERTQMAAQAVLQGAVGFLQGAVGTFFQLFGILFVGIYLLADIRRYKAAYLRAIPARYRHDAQALWEEVAHTLSRSLGGLLLSVGIQGALAFVALSLLGVPYAFLLGLWTAATGVLPYVGAWLGAIPAVLVTLVDSPRTALLVVLVYVAINLVEGNLLTPRIQAQAVRAHPLLIFIAVLASGEIAGLAGAALAVPLVAVLRVLVGFFAVRPHVRH